MQSWTGLAQRQEQRLALAPKMLQSIEILRMAAVELEAAIARELETNEVLEVGARRAAAPADRAPGRGGGGDADGAADWLHAVAGPPPTLVDHLRAQIAWAQLPPGLEHAVLLLAGQLDDRGLLQASDQELAELVGGDVLEEALAVLRSLEPRGVGARDAVEALLLQVPAADPDRADIERLLTEQLRDVARRRFTAVARALGCDVARVERLVDRVRGLRPVPAAEFAQSVEPALHADVVVEEFDGELEVRVDDASLPDLWINEDYRAMAADRECKTDVRRYLRDKIEAARGLLTALEQRQRTLARVAAAVMQHQRAFLTHGEAAIRPLRMAEIADSLDLHPSTVSRAVAGKNVATARGVYPLRAFFDGGRAAGGRSGRRSVAQRIAELIAGEDPQHPLSDEDLVRRLADGGLSVARRTIAKYRGELGIPAMWQRRQ